MAKPALGSYHIEPLDDRCDRANFSCGVEGLDGYLRTQAGQDSRKRVATCFVLVGENGSLAGYYTLSATSISLVDLPIEIARKLPRYPAIPATLLGRLAVDQRHRGHGLGAFLLVDAFSRTLRSEIATFAFVVDAKDETAQSFYTHYGFRGLQKDGRRLFLPLAEVAAAFA